MQSKENYCVVVTYIVKSEFELQRSIQKSFLLTLLLFVILPSIWTKPCGTNHDRNTCIVNVLTRNVVLGM